MGIWLIIRPGRQSSACHSQHLEDDRFTKFSKKYHLLSMYRRFWGERTNEIY